MLTIWMFGTNHLNNCGLVGFCLWNLKVIKVSFLEPLQCSRFQNDSEQLMNQLVAEWHRTGRIFVKLRVSCGFVLRWMCGTGFICVVAGEAEFVILVIGRGKDYVGFPKHQMFYFSFRGSHWDFSAQLASRDGSERIKKKKKNKKMHWTLLWQLLSSWFTRQ